MIFRLFKYLTALLLCSLLSSSAFALKVGVSMPSTHLARWSYDGRYLKEYLEQANHKVDVRYANDSDIAHQINDIRNLIESGCEVLVVAPVDGVNLIAVLEEAKAKDIPVIAYDRLIMGTDAIKAYVTFDNYKIGQLQANYIEKKLALSFIGSNSANIEIFEGDISDRCVDYYYRGSMDVLKPYFDEKKLFCLSNQTKLDDVTIVNWSSELAYERMKMLIKTNNYGPASTNTKLDAVLAANDSVANGVIKALLEAGYDKSRMPVITGQDCDLDSLFYIKTGLQSMSVFVDVRLLAKNTVRIVNSFAETETINDYDRLSYFNGVTNIPALVSEPEIVTKKKIKSVLFDSGYYSKEDNAKLKKRIKESRK